MTSTTTMITFQCFARARELTNKEQITLDCPIGLRLDDALQLLSVQEPELTEVFLGRCRFAIQKKYVKLTTILADNSTIMIIPPISGG